MARNCAVSLLAAGRMLLLLGAAPVASAFSPRMEYRGREWTPAKPTRLASVTLAGVGDVSPAPTEAPRHGGDFGGVELFKRDYTMGSDTCGFAAQYKSEPWTCFRVDASCVSFSTAMGCCNGKEPDCHSTILMSCRDYTSGVSASCGTGTLCCASASPSCFTWQYSTTNSAGQAGSTYSIFNCYVSGGTGTLLSTPPALRLSGTSSVKTESTRLNPPDTTPTTTGGGGGGGSGSSQTSPPAPAPNSNSASNNIGVIVGGAVGGAAILAGVIVAVFWLVMRNKREKAAAAAAAAAAGNGGPGTAAGGGGGVAGFAGGGAYPPSGVSPGQTTVSPVTAVGSPHMSQNGYFAVPQQGQYPGPDGRYPSYYEPAKQQPSPVHSDPRYSVMQPQHTGNSMGGGGGGQWHAPAGSPQQAPPMELATTNPVGSTGNRAELL
ncbi:hypothetical protein RB597_003483 [Gaeumannomyces tritici]